jgi:hypothetical protein
MDVHKTGYELHVCRVNHASGFVTIFGAQSALVITMDARKE